ncbi:conserved hypothetical protein [Rubrivivax sp. A210]|uniref:hypothetical protein n=1 Tax=Rubrivivax sp. A210 TaxID=2772301 RepID=UPI001919129B|nr:hypothetical protein [Rubrivivax sp. A210]CAD5373087.1 conserved hypothetical protein [Rubrivivax sp. A210]
MVAKTKKMTLAREQLEDGISLLMAARYVSALTLLGAAEEILARLLQEAGGEHPLDDYWKGINEIRRARGGEDLSKSFIHRHFNEPRNQVKHHTPGDAHEVVLHKVAAAVMMARRATTAAKDLNLKYKHQEALDTWLRANDFL